MTSKSLLPPVLSPLSLYKAEAKRDETNIKTYNIILGQIYNKIKTASQIANSDKLIWYIVPEFIPGVPKFSLEEAILYIVWNLRNAGYTVDFVYPTGLYISWKSYDESYYKSESPWNKVLQTVKHTVENEIKPVEKPKISPPKQTFAPIVKRKTVLKKTAEYKPPSIDKPNTVLQAFKTETPSVKLPGQLSDKHVSFV